MTKMATKCDAKIQNRLDQKTSHGIRRGIDSSLIENVQQELRAAALWETYHTPNPWLWEVINVKEETQQELVDAFLQVS